MKLKDLIDISWPRGDGKGLYASSIDKIWGTQYSSEATIQYDDKIIFVPLAPSNSPTDIDRYALIKVNNQQSSEDAKLANNMVITEKNADNILLTKEIIDFFLTNHALHELVESAISKNTFKKLIDEIDNFGKLKEAIDDVHSSGKLEELVVGICCSKKLIKLKEVVDDGLKEKIIEIERKNKYLQQIIYGPAGVGKTYSIRKKVADELGIEEYEKSTIHTVFHPEYSYFDFFGKVMPKKDSTQSTSVNIIYDFYPGPFIEALLQSYENIINKKTEKTLLVIDELNRGNAAAIFGSLFNLLDRNENGVSEYPLNIYGMEYDWLKDKINKLGQDKVKDLEKYYVDITDKKSFEIITQDSMKIFIPQNLSIICTMNTSDETIFTLDKAFERRWKKSFITAQNSIENYEYKNIILENFKDNQSKDVLWVDFLPKINKFIEDNIELEDIDNAKIGAYFIKPVCNEIKKEDIQYSLMYNLWFGLFKGWQREVMLDNLPDDFKDVKTFESFSNKVDEFIKAIYYIT